MCEIECFQEQAYSFLQEWISPRALKRKKLVIQVSASSNSEIMNSVNKNPVAPQTEKPMSALVGGENMSKETSGSYTPEKQVEIKPSVIRPSANRHVNHNLRIRTKPHLKLLRYKTNNKWLGSTPNALKDEYNLAGEAKSKATFWPRTPRPQMISSGPEASRGASVDSNNQYPNQNIIINPHHRMSADASTSHRNTLPIERHKSHHVKMNILGTNFSSARDSGSYPGSHRLSTIRSEIMSLTIMQAASNMLEAQKDLEVGPSQDRRAIENGISGIQTDDGGNAPQYSNFPAQPLSQFVEKGEEVRPNDPVPDERGANCSRTSADLNCRYRRRKAMLPLRKLRKKPSLSSVRFSFNLQPKRILVNRSRQDLLLRARYCFLQMKSSSRIASSSGIANQGSSGQQKSMIQLWIDNLVKAAVKMAVGDRNLHQSKEAGPSLLRDWVDNIVEREISRAGHDLNEADKDSVRVQVYDAVRYSIQSLPGSKSSSKGSKKKTKNGKGSKRATPSGSSSPSSSRSRKRKRGKVKKGSKESGKQTSSSSPASSHESDSRKAGKPRKKKRIMKSPTPSPNLSTVPPENADNNELEPNFTKTPKTTTKIPFQRRATPPKSSDESDYPPSQSSENEQDDSYSSEPESGETLEGNRNRNTTTSPLRSTQGGRGKLAGGSSTSLQTFDLDEFEAARMRFDVIPTVLPMPATAGSPKPGVPPLANVSPANPVEVTKGHKNGPAFTSTPTKGNSGSVRIVSRTPQKSNERSRTGSSKADTDPDTRKPIKLNTTPSKAGSRWLSESHKSQALPQRTQVVSSAHKLS